MTNAPTRPLSPLAAITAASLFLSTPALAQSAQPPDIPPQTDPTQPPQPEVPAPAQPEPSPIAPEASTSPAPVMTTNPVVQALPDSSETPPAPAPQPRAAQTSSSPRDTPQTATARAPATTPPRETSATQAPAGITRRDPAGLYTAPTSTAPTSTGASSAAATATAAPSPYVRYWPLEAGGAFILLGLIAYAATRRRDEEEEDTPAPTASLTPQVSPTARGTTVAAHNDSPVLVGPVPTGAAREALLKRMVEAAPDAENPFTTRKARMHRARLILQSRKQALRERAVETFDWRTYRPSLTHPTLGQGGKKDPADHDT